MVARTLLNVTFVCTASVFIIISEAFAKGYKIPSIENDDFSGHGVLNIDW